MFTDLNRVNFREMAFRYQRRHVCQCSTMERSWCVQVQTITQNFDIRTKGVLCFDFNCVPKEGQVVFSGIAASPYQTRESFVLKFQSFSRRTLIARPAINKSSHSAMVVFYEEENPLTCHAGFIVSLERPSKT